MQYSLENEQLKVTVFSRGAELRSIRKKETGAEYLWNGDARYWGWTSPVLFPFVGAVRDRKYRYQGKTYDMKQHGFAREQEFALLSQKPDEIWFACSDTEETRKVYPFAFCLKLGYRLRENRVEVLWQVTNTGEEPMFFSIGAHPAFLCPPKAEGKQSDCCIGFETEKDQILYKRIDLSCNLIAPEEYALPLKDGLYRIEENCFDLDALIVEGDQTKKVWLAGPDGKPYVSVAFDAPLFGLWSPAKKNAPFVCIEPWYGRSDGTDFYGSLEERAYSNTAKPQETFARSYEISIF